MRTAYSPKKASGFINVIRVVIATLIALIGLTFVLPQAAADPSPHRAYLPMVAANTGLTRQARTTGPNTAISVIAEASASCKEGEMAPVTGARITVITDHGTRIGMTNESGYALFSAANEPVVIQIEWPAGFFPCPNSRPMVELPGGAGEVTFVATAAH